MSKAAPGSLRWWQNTALITGGGIALAIWLWDGWPFVFFFREAIIFGTPAPNLGTYLDLGCFTGDNLSAMAQGRPTTISCPDTVRFIEREAP